MTWTSYHNRGEILRTVIAVANTRRDGRLPMDVEGVAQTFGDELSLLAALQLKWHTRLAGHIDKELQSQPVDLTAAVARAWGEARDELPGVRLMLDHYREQPLNGEMERAMRRATAKEHSMLAVMAGRAGVADRAARVGADIEAQARRRNHLERARNAVPFSQETTTLFGRLKAAVSGAPAA